MAKQKLSHIESFYGVLADANRLRILAMLQETPLCVCQLSQILGITAPSVSRHLKKLKEHSLLIDEQDGYWTVYSLAKHFDAQDAAILAQALAAVADDETVRTDAKKAAKSDRAKACACAEQR